MFCVSVRPGQALPALPTAAGRHLLPLYAAALLPITACRWPLAAVAGALPSCSASLPELLLPRCTAPAALLCCFRPLPARSQMLHDALSRPSWEGWVLCLCRGPSLLRLLCRLPIQLHRRARCTRERRWAGLSRLALACCSAAVQLLPPPTAAQARRAAAAQSAPPGPALACRCARQLPVHSVQAAQQLGGCCLEGRGPQAVLLEHPGGVAQAVSHLPAQVETDEACQGAAGGLLPLPAHAPVLPRLPQPGYSLQLWRGVQHRIYGCQHAPQAGASQHQRLNGQRGSAGTLDRGSAAKQAMHGATLPAPVLQRFEQPELRMHAKPQPTWPMRSARWRVGEAHRHSGPPSARCCQPCSTRCASGLGVHGDRAWRCQLGRRAARRSPGACSRASCAGARLNTAFCPAASPAGPPLQSSQTAASTWRCGWQG